MTKKLITEHLMSYNNLDGTRVSTVVKELGNLLDQYGDTLVFETKQEPWDDYETTEIRIERLETDEEYNKRTLREKVEREQQKEYDLQLLAKLQAKYAEGN